jgi:hypothetical protein
MASLTTPSVVATTISGVLLAKPEAAISALPFIARITMKFLDFSENISTDRPSFLAS